MCSSVRFAILHGGRGFLRLGSREEKGTYNQQEEDHEANAEPHELRANFIPESLGNALQQTLKPQYLNTCEAQSSATPFAPTADGTRLQTAST